MRLVEAAGTKLSNVWIAAIPGRVLVYKSRSASYPIQAFPVGASLQQVAEMGEYEQYYAALNFFGNQSNGAMMYPHLEAAVDWVLLHTFDFQSMREWAQALKEDKERPPETPAKKTRPVPARPRRPPPAAAVPPPGNRDGGRFSFAALPAPPAEAEPAVQGTSPADAEAPARSGGSSWTGSEWGSEWGSSDSYSNSYSGSEGWSDGGWDADGGLLDVSLVEKREDAEPPPPPRHLYPKDHPQYRALVLMESVGVQADVPRSISVQTDPETALVQLPAEVHSRESVAVEVPVSEVAVEHRDTRFRVEPIAEAEEKGAGVGAAAAGGAAPARRDSQWDERSTPNGRTYYYNRETRRSTFRKPSVDLPFLDKAEKDAQAEKGGDGVWTEHYGPEGKKYWYNKATGRKSFNGPDNKKRDNPGRGSVSLGQRLDVRRRHGGRRVPGRLPVQQRGRVVVGVQDVGEDLGVHVRQVLVPLPEELQAPLRLERVPLQVPDAVDDPRVEPGQRHQRRAPGPLPERVDLPPVLDPEVVPEERLQHLGVPHLHLADLGVVRRDRLVVHHPPASHDLDPALPHQRLEVRGVRPPRPLQPRLQEDALALQMKVRSGAARSAAVTDVRMRLTSVSWYPRKVFL